MFKKLAFLTLAVAFFFLTVLPAAADDVIRGTDRVEEIMDYLYHHHLGRPGVDQLVDGAVRGMLDSLGDPYTEYFSSEELDNFTGTLDGDYVGVGLELEGWPPYPVVVKVMPNSPAYRAGIREKDLIVRVDGQDTTGLTLFEVVKKIRGPAGSRVVLTIRRAGGKDFDLEMVRETFSSPTIDWHLLSGNIGYVKVHIFGSHTAEEFSTVLKELQARRVKGLIMDLRNNPGGYLQAAVDMAGSFLPAGRVVVTTLDRDGKKENYYTTGDGIAQGLPLVLLVNGMSASSAEVLAGALHEYRAAVLVGERTYGKGVVQAIIPLETGGALKLTVARYLTPLGNSIDGRGLTPDRIVSTPELQLVAARQELQPGLSRQVVFNRQGKGVFVDGEKVRSFWTPLFRADRSYLPLRFTLEALGFDAEWREEQGRVLASAGKRNIIIVLGQKTVIVDGHTLILERPALRFENRIYVPDSLFSRLGANIVRNKEQLKLELSLAKQE